MVHVKTKDLMAMVEHAFNPRTQESTVFMADLYEFKASQVCTESTKTTRKYMVRPCSKKEFEE